MPAHTHCGISRDLMQRAAPGMSKPRPTSRTFACAACSNRSTRRCHSARKHAPADHCAESGRSRKGTYSAPSHMRHPYHGQGPLSGLQPQPHLQQHTTAPVGCPRSNCAALSGGYDIDTGIPGQHAPRAASGASCLPAHRTLAGLSAGKCTSLPQSGHTQRRRVYFLTTEWAHTRATGEST